MYNSIVVLRSMQPASYSTLTWRRSALKRCHAHSDSHSGITEATLVSRILNALGSLATFSTQRSDLFTQTSQSFQVFQPGSSRGETRWIIDAVFKALFFSSPESESHLAKYLRVTMRLSLSSNCSLSVADFVKFTLTTNVIVTKVWFTTGKDTFGLSGNFRCFARMSYVSEKVSFSRGL